VVAVRVLVALAGGLLVVSTLLSAIKSVVLPRASPTLIGRAVYFSLQGVFRRIAHEGRPFAERDRILAFYAPLTLVLLPGVWVALTITAFTAIFWGTGVNGLTEAFVTSGSSVVTLGFVRPDGVGRVALTFLEATLGLGYVALLISYLPSMYAGFGRRELLVGLLESRAGIPPSPVEMLGRYQRIGALERIDEDLFVMWETWFVDVEETHTSIPAMVFFRSPQPGRSWITAAGCVLDAAALVASTVDRPRSSRSELCIRTGYLALRRIADVFGIAYDPAPKPTDPISISRREFDNVCVELEAAGIALKANRDAAWQSFAGWRVNYDAALVGLARLVVAPDARWSTDRAGEPVVPRFRRRARRPAR
jgi:hypothetical protein